MSELEKSFDSAVLMVEEFAEKKLKKWCQSMGLSKYLDELKKMNKLVAFVGAKLKVIAGVLAAVKKRTDTLTTRRGRTPPAPHILESLKDLTRRLLTDRLSGT